MTIAPERAPIAARLLFQFPPTVEVESPAAIVVRAGLLARRRAESDYNNVITVPEGVKTNIRKANFFGRVYSQVSDFYTGAQAARSMGAHLVSGEIDSDTYVIGAVDAQDGPFTITYAAATEDGGEPTYTGRFENDTEMDPERAQQGVELLADPLWAIGIVRRGDNFSEDTILARMRERTRIQQQLDHIPTVSE